MTCALCGHTKELQRSKVDPDQLDAILDAILAALRTDTVGIPDPNVSEVVLDLDGLDTR